MPLQRYRKNFEINISDQLLNVFLLKKKTPHILKELLVIFFMYTVIPERALEMKIILNASEGEFIFRVNDNYIVYAVLYE